MKEAALEPIERWARDEVDSARDVSVGHVR